MSSALPITKDEFVERLTWACHFYRTSKEEFGSNWARAVSMGVRAGLQPDTNCPIEAEKVLSFIMTKSEEDISTLHSVVDDAWQYYCSMFPSYRSVDAPIIRTGEMGKMDGLDHPWKKY